ncbi:hypothetical protein LEL_11022 [Akanthomyces lecanii RCEF 1005]|uniref:Uncharacterized protein n=1 Tax=Akanthomyces lecanii RCEF 1005 TaxID=1081108 RepID=A0A167LQV9_CORDF|nr:hypothetical protein LEL_11022 [Akanthomyces lecanii RCEF 1005]
MEMMAQSRDNPQALNEATTNTTTNEVDTEMADTAERNATTTPEEDCLPALGEDEDMGDTEQRTTFRTMKGFWKKTPNQEGLTSEDENDEDNSGDDDEAAPIQQSRQQEQPTANQTRIVRTTLIHRMGVSEIKPPRLQLSSKPTYLKKRYINPDLARQIIPSENTNPSSDAPAEQDDAPAEQEIRVRTFPRHSPPSSPPREARRRDQ